MNSSNYNYSVVILAAGLSERMGQPKYALKFDKRQTFLERIIEEYIQFGKGRIEVVMNSFGYNSKIRDSYKESQQVHFVENATPEKGRFASVKLGLSAIENEVPVFIQNVDNPFISKRVLKELSSYLSFNSYCVPVYHGRGGHPILISPEVINDLLKIDSSEITLKDALFQFIRVNVDVNDNRILENINTMEDYLKWFGKFDI